MLALEVRVYIVYTVVVDVVVVVVVGLWTVIIC